MLWGKSSSKEYEEHVERALARKYPKGQWNLEKQSPITGTREKVDFRLKNRKTGRQILVDAKSGAVSISDLRQLYDYKRSTKTSAVIIYTPTPLSNLSEGIKQKAKKMGIKIQYSAPRDVSLF